MIKVLQKNSKNLMFIILKNKEKTSEINGLLIFRFIDKDPQGVNVLG